MRVPGLAMHKLIAHTLRPLQTLSYSSRPARRTTAPVNSKAFIDLPVSQT